MRSIATAVLLVLAGCASPSAPSASPSTTAEVPPTASSSTLASSSSPAGEPSIDEAVALARDELEWAAENWHVISVDSGPLGQVRPGWEETAWGSGLSADLAVWRIVMAAGELSSEVVIGFRDGAVLGSVIGIAN